MSGRGRLLIIRLQRVDERCNQQQCDRVQTNRNPLRNYVRPSGWISPNQRTSENKET